MMSIMSNMIAVVSFMGLIIATCAHVITGLSNYFHYFWDCDIS